MTTRRKAMWTLATASLISRIKAKASTAPQDPREFGLILSRYNDLLLTADNAGYRLCLVQNTHEGELKRTSFSGFVLQDELAPLVFESRYEEEAESFVRLTLQKQFELGERNNHRVNYGEWAMTVTGKGFRFDELKKMLLEERASPFWTPEDSLVFRGKPAREMFDEDSLHR